MSTALDRLARALVARVARLPTRQRGVFLLAYAERFVRMFGLFEARAGQGRASFESLLDRLWELAEGAAVDPSLSEAMVAAIPGEDWVVDGFYDAIAQYVGGLACGAWEGLGGAASIEGEPEHGVFDLLRLVLSEMRLGCPEPGETTAVARQFEAGLHTEKLIVDEVELWRALERRVSEASVREVRGFAAENVFDPACLEPELSIGLAKDRASSRS